MEVAGLILDVYDLTPEDLARDRAALEKIGAMDAERLDPDALDKLPDHQFGLVGITKRGRKVRRFPLHDSEHAKLAALYFSRNGPKLPTEVAEKVAARIHAACLHHGVPSPLGSAQIEKVAESLLEGAIDLGAASHTTLGMARATTPDPVDDDYAVIVERGNGEKIAYYYIGDRKALKEAAETFEDNGWREIRQPELRAKIAQSIAERLSGEDLPVPPTVANYASTDVNPEFATWVDARLSLVPHEKRAALKQLVQKKAEFSGHGLGRALETFDRMTGLDQYWDVGLADPFKSCYAAPIQSIKVGKVELRPEDLKKLAGDPKRLGQFFDTYGVLEFQRDPEGVFSSLPLPTQELIASEVSER
jgi:hypothetical protein